MKTAQNSFLLIGMNKKKLRCEKFLDEMEKIIPWEAIVEVLKEYYGEKDIGRKKTDLLLILKIYFLQQWYNLSDPGVEEAVYDRNSFQKFLKIDLIASNVPDETTILNFRHFIEENNLSKELFELVNEMLEEKGLLMKRGTTVDASIIVASSSTKNRKRERDPEMSSTKKGNNYKFGMKVHTGTDIESGIVHTLKGTTAKDHDMTQFENLLHGKERIVSGDKGYYSDKRKKEFRRKGIQYAVIDKAKRGHKLSRNQKKKNKKKSSIRAIVEHPFNVVKNLWKHRKVRYKGIHKNICHFYTLFALANLYKVRYQLI
jgi:transposase, IS5 family